MHAVTDLVTVICGWMFANQRAYNAPNNMSLIKALKAFAFLLQPNCRAFMVLDIVDEKQIILSFWLEEEHFLNQFFYRC